MFAEKVIPRLRPRFSRVGGQLVSARGRYGGCAIAQPRAGAGEMNSEIVNLPNGRRWQVYTGGEGPDILWLHGLRGVDPADPLLAALAEALPHHRPGRARLQRSR